MDELDIVDVDPSNFEELSSEISNDNEVIEAVEKPGFQDDRLDKPAKRVDKRTKEFKADCLDLPDAPAKDTLVAKIRAYYTSYPQITTEVTGSSKWTSLAVKLSKSSISKLVDMVNEIEVKVETYNAKRAMTGMFFTVIGAFEGSIPNYDLSGLAKDLQANQDVQNCLDEIAAKWAPEVSQYMTPEIRLAVLVLPKAMQIARVNKLKKIQENVVVKSSKAKDVDKFKDL